MQLTEYYNKNNILTINSDPKTIKGTKKGYLTAIMYLSPHKISGRNLCPFASLGCIKACLFSSGMGKFSNVIEGRVNKTNYYVQNRIGFVTQLIKEIEKTKSEKISGR